MGEPSGAGGSSWNAEWDLTQLDPSGELVWGQTGPVSQDRKDDLNNFKPISLVNVFSKLLNSMAEDRLNQYLKDYHILLNNSFAYKKHRSTMSCFN